MAATPSILAAIAGYGVFLWLGLYVLLRGGVRALLIRVAVAGLLTQSMFFFAAAWTDAATDPVRNLLLERWTWWTAVLPLAIWFHLSSLMARGFRRPEQRDAFVPGRAVASYAIALVLIALGTATDLFNVYQVAAGIRPGPAYGLYLLFQVLMSVGALFNFVQARRVLVHSAANNSAVRQLNLLIGGSLPFALGGLWLGLRFLFGLPGAELPGYLLLFVGIVPLGYGVANYGLLLEGQNIQRDFFYTFTGIALLNIVYTLLIGLTTDITVGGLLALVTLVTLTHTAFDSGRSWLDRLFFSSAEQQARAEARDFATALGSAPVTPPAEELPAANAATPEPATENAGIADGSDQKAFKDDVRKALTGLKSPPRLVNSPLLTLDAVTKQLADQELPDNRLNRVSALRDVLIQQIQSLRPNESAEPRVGEAWRFYNVLYYPYVRELSRKAALAEARRLREERLRAGQRQPGDLEQVLEWLADVDEDTFYKWQRRASDTIAEALLAEQ